MPNKSYGQDLIDQSIGQQQLKNVEKEARERQKMIENSRKSNFELGDVHKGSQYASVTSNSAAYNPEYLLLAGGYDSKTNVSANDFKKANFKLGSNNPDYITTNNHIYTEKNQEHASPSINPINQKKQNFHYGNDLTSYLSIA